LPFFIRHGSEIMFVAAFHQIRKPPNILTTFLASSTPHHQQQMESAPIQDHHTFLEKKKSLRYIYNT